MLPNFEGIRYFSPLSMVYQWGDPSKIDHGLLLKVDALRYELNTPLIITSGYRPQDMGSQHALGLALDIMAPKFTGSLYDIYLAAEHLNFKGLGVYPDWVYMGKKLGGLHVDERIATKPSRWMGVLIQHKQEYIALNSTNLKLHGVV